MIISAVRKICQPQRLTHPWEFALSWAFLMYFPVIAIQHPAGSISRNSRPASRISVLVFHRWPRCTRRTAIGLVLGSMQQAINFLVYQ
ncbi:hypothetical protein F4679DRAFT_531914 [Xylaria curta]|nr:hypothetical protein F4679DRAFT_531914 [Xylaria curta]